MNWLLDHTLTGIVFLPLLGALSIVLVGRERTRLIRWLALIFSVGTFLLAARAFWLYSPEHPGLQYVEQTPWISSPPIDYFLGADGLSLLMVLLTAFLTPVAILASWEAVEQRAKEFFLFLLVLETGTLGVFLALDLFLFYIFWEAMLIPMYFLIGIWGHERRIYATLKFVLFTMTGSVFMLVGILYLYRVTGSFNWVTILDRLSGPEAVLAGKAQIWLFLAFFIAFAIKVPLFPLHTWLPDAHVEAPTAGSVILAGVLLKTGAYGLLRFCLPLFPDAAHELAPFISFLAIVGILYGGLVSMVQPDLKKLVAYSSVSHLGFIVLGIFAFNTPGIEGAIYQMCSHGVSTGALFILVGMLYERRHTRQIRDFGGLATPLPVLSSFFVLVALSSLGLPLLNGFVGEFLILLGAFKARALYGVLGALGVVVAAIYLLWMIQRVLFGEVTHPANRSLRDCKFREGVILTALAVVIIGMGVYPQPFLRRLDQTTQRILTRLQGGSLHFTGEHPFPRNAVSSSSVAQPLPWISRKTVAPNRTR